MTFFKRTINVVLSLALYGFVAYAFGGAAFKSESEFKRTSGKIVSLKSGKYLDITLDNGRTQTFSLYQFSGYADIVTVMHEGDSIEMLVDHNEPAQIKKGDVMVYPLSRYHNKYLFVVGMCVVMTLGMLTWWAWPFIKRRRMDRTIN